MNVQLQPLRIPAGWYVGYNNGLWEIDPDPELVPADDRWWIFKEDMLQMTHPRFRRMLDVGWYPEGDLSNGHYRIVVHEDGFRGRCLHELVTRDRLLLVEEIERLLGAVCDGKV